MMFDSFRGYVLAGGESSRMRGCDLPPDKASLLWNGQTLLTRATSLLQTVCGEVGVLCGTEERCTRLGLGERGIQDRLQGLGPLGGLEAALADAEEHGAMWVLVVPVDLPRLPSHLLLALMNKSLVQEANVCCLRSAGRTEPLPAAVRVDALLPLQEALLAGHRKLLPVLNSLAERLSSKVGLTVIDVPEPGSSDQDSGWFWNVNTPEEFSLLQQGERRNE